MVLSRVLIIEWHIGHADLLSRNDWMQLSQKEWPQYKVPGLKNSLSLYKQNLSNVYYSFAVSQIAYSKHKIKISQTKNLNFKLIFYSVIIGFCSF